MLQLAQKPPDFSGLASGVNNAVSRVAALFAIALLGAIMASIFSAKLIVLVEETNLSESESGHILDQSGRLAGIVVPDSFPAAAQVSAKKVINESFVSGFRKIMILSALLSLISAFAAFIAIKPKTEIVEIVRRQPI